MDSSALAPSGDCPNCNASHDVGAVVGDYLFNVEWDQKIFPCRKILQCDRCKLVYAWPMPDETELTDYYSNIYRAVGRPHHFSGQPEVLYRHLAYLSYITTFVSLSEVTRVYEIGAGFGEMGSLLKSVNPKIELLTHEPDSHTRDKLEQSGYTVLPIEASVEGDVDLVISIHSMEHFTDLQHFFSLTNSLRFGGYFFVEVPNCTIEDGWLERPYDSPHLMFFDAETLKESFESRGYEAIAISKSGISLREDFSLCAEWKQQFGGWLPGESHSRRQHMTSPREIVKSFLPNRVKRVIRAAMNSVPSGHLALGAADINNSASQGWLLRGLFRKV